MKNTAIIGIIVIVLVIIVVGAYLYTSSASKAQSTASSIPYTTVSSVNTTVASTSASTTLNSSITTTISNSSNSTITTTITNSSVTTTITNVSLGPYDVNVAYNSSVGNYLVNQNGTTLYIDSADTPNSGNSTCYSSCAAVWPPFYMNITNLTVSGGLNVSSFNAINRTDGTIELTYKGYPLYFFAGDSSPGQVNGNNVNGFFAATTPNVTT